MIDWELEGRAERSNRLICVWRWQKFRVEHRILNGERSCRGTRQRYAQLRLSLNDLQILWISLSLSLHTTPFWVLFFCRIKVRQEKRVRWRSHLMLWKGKKLPEKSNWTMVLDSFSSCPLFLKRAADRCFRTVWFFVGRLFCWWYTRWDWGIWFRAFFLRIFSKVVKKFQHQLEKPFS